jgi:hypothetical protein
MSAAEFSPQLPRQSDQEGDCGQRGRARLPGRAEQDERQGQLRHLSLQQPATVLNDTPAKPLRHHHRSVRIIAIFDSAAAVANLLWVW